MIGITAIGTGIISVTVIGILSYKAYTDRPRSKAISEESTPSSTHGISGNQTSSIDFIFTKTSRSPKTNIEQVINSARSTLDIAMFTLTDKNIVQRVIEAKNRGVKVRIITDSEQSTNKYQLEALHRLHHEGITIKKNIHSGLMHLKMTIADDSTIVAGSYNYTRRASEANDEMIFIVKSHDDIKTCVEHFAKMWNDSQNYVDSYMPHPMRKYA